MVSSVRDPILLTQVSWRIDDKLAAILIIGQSSLHLDGIISISKLSKTEAPNNVKIINLVKNVVMSIVVECLNASSKQVHLNCELDCGCWAN